MMNEIWAFGHRLSQKHVPLIPKLIFYFNRLVFACDIPLDTQIGKGTFFTHSGLGVVIHNKSVIGKNCKIYQNVTIGGRGIHGVPVIENNVLIGASSVVMGGIKVGHHSIIGAHSVVFHDVPPYSVVAGNPARVIKQVNYMKKNIATTKSPIPSTH